MTLNLYHKTAFKTSRVVTHCYSTSFSFATSLLKTRHRNAIYAIYGFVRFSDEIVDTFHGHNKRILLEKFEQDLKDSISEGISLNPILHAFQIVVQEYKIPYEYIDAFLSSMKHDLDKKEYTTRLETDAYIYGSADVVGLMCLRVFCDGDEQLFQSLKKPAMKLGSAFQKVNFLRDFKSDIVHLGRSYFPQVNIDNFNEQTKQQIIKDIKNDFAEAYPGIIGLPHNARNSVLLAYYYYINLLNKIERQKVEAVLNDRIRISNFKKMMLYVKARTLSKMDLL